MRVDQSAIPQAPAGLPAGVATKWQEAYATVLSAHSHRSIDQARREALQAANELLRTPELESYSAAMALDAWHFQLREPSNDGRTLRVVTRHGDKYTFPIPEKESQ
jgi:hypothetical protein